MNRLKNGTQDKAFFVYEGGAIKNLYELEDTLASMKQSSFSHHVSTVRNDFSNWVRDVVGDSSLALTLSLKKTRKEMENAVKERINELEEQHMPAHASKSMLNRVIVDFVIGLVIGIVAGLLIGSFL